MEEEKSNYSNPLTLVMHYPFAPCHRCIMFEEVITRLVIELVMTLTDHIDCIVENIKIIIDINLMEWNSEILKNKIKIRTVGGQQY